jgi:hypothetical protein
MEVMGQQLRALDTGNPLGVRDADWEIGVFLMESAAERVDGQTPPIFAMWSGAEDLKVAVARCGRLSPGNIMDTSAA